MTDCLVANTLAVDYLSADFKRELKQLIIDECDKDLAVDEIADDAPLLRGDLDLDSLDVLQICMAIKVRYDVRIEGSSAARKALVSVNTLAATIASAKA
jgi:acyl carrier protein